MTCTAWPSFALCNPYSLHLKIWRLAQPRSQLFGICKPYSFCSNCRVRSTTLLECQLVVMVIRFFLRVDDGKFIFVIDIPGSRRGLIGPQGSILVHTPCLLQCLLRKRVPTDHHSLNFRLAHHITHAFQVEKRLPHLRLTRGATHGHK